MKTITKYCKTIYEAVKFRDRLYSQYDTVILLDSPLFSESGIYVFSVK